MKPKDGQGCADGSAGGQPCQSVHREGHGGLGQGDTSSPRQPHLTDGLPDGAGNVLPQLGRVEGPGQGSFGPLPVEQGNPASRRAGQARHHQRLRSNRVFPAGKHASLGAIPRVPENDAHEEQPGHAEENSEDLPAPVSSGAQPMRRAPTTRVSGARKPRGTAGLMASAPQPRS
jgi:hypothetical protein